MKPFARALSALTTTVLLSAAPSAQASEHGCRVLLCLAATAGTPSACVPTLNKLWHDLAKGRAFPTCDLADGNDGNSYARMGRSHYDLCPSGTNPLDEGQYAAPSSAPQGRGMFGKPTVAWQHVSQGIGTGSTQQQIGWGYNDNLKPMICVGSIVGQAMSYNTSSSRYQYVNVTLYDQVFVLNANASPRIIDVYVNNSVYTRVRY